MNTVETVQHATGLDIVATIIVVVIVAASLLTLLGMGAMMAIGAVMSNRPLVTSWSPEQEHRFAPFEARSSSSSSFAWLISFLCAGGFALAAIVVFVIIPPESKDMTKGMHMSNISKRGKVDAPAEAPKAEAPKADAPKADAPAEAPKADSTVPAEAPKADSTVPAPAESPKQ